MQGKKIETSLPRLEHQQKIYALTAHSTSAALRTY